jgi:choline dehydrogenase-like flavoprotein
MTRDQFDIVVVGAGPAGCAVAARLADARPNWNIALIETGPARANTQAPAAMIGEKAADLILADAVAGQALARAQAQSVS